MVLAPKVRRAPKGKPKKPRKKASTLKRPPLVPKPRNWVAPALKNPEEGEAVTLDDYIINTPEDLMQGIRKLKQQDIEDWGTLDCDYIKRPAIRTYLAKNPDLVMRHLELIERSGWLKLSRGCWLWNGWMPKNGSLYISLCVGSQTWWLHRFAYLTKGHGWPKGDASHLCHHPHCFNPDHLIDEAKPQNNRRKNCKVFVMVETKRFSKRTGQPKKSRRKIIWLCKHEPLCYRYCSWYPDKSMSQLRRHRHTIEETDNGSDNEREPRI